ncbi:holo-ACP synthase [Pullulanibacillus sp. KACC 23026]|uniref:holo-ACP synthase n=1 Tax=Pullulanibacillus sp. KACC 23026 TaxID=3028315 RepID=UPI0023AEB548|nr:holo-ACP synthase [Pullulanibacillus sp. KACC 23026]WEG12532.1 holo-ACP synthase [Pullulanibacillus sp. KACC 23026]
MIKGIGMDLVEMDRIEQAMKNERFIKRVLGTSEYQVYLTLSERRQLEFVAGRFAAKEAFSKAFGTGIGKALSWQDVEILNDSAGKPILTSTVCSETESVHVSLTHTKEMAAAYVIIEGLSG